MKQFMKDFCLRGLVAMGFGPVVLGIIYGILGATGAVESLAPMEVAKGVLSITLMAFIAAGITSIYQQERLPLPIAIGLHAVVLYLDYLVMYLFNDWIVKEATALGIFSAIFFGGFALIWLVIFLTSRRSTKKLNEKLAK